MFARMRDLVATGQLQIPPPIFTDMDGQFLAFDPVARQLTARFPFKARYQNPMGYMQGGMIAAAIDNTIGPLSFMVAPPNVTKSMTVTYLRPITTAIQFITVIARQEPTPETADREIIFTADVLRDSKTVLAQAHSLNIILKRWRKTE